MDRNIAVVGWGYWGKNLVRNLAEHGALHTIYDSNSAFQDVIIDMRDVLTFNI
jgi:6-phosphogluconate dehydrogenase